MAEKEDKVILEREYTVPMRRKFLNTPQYKRTPKAIKALKEFIAKHMKVVDRDTRKVKLDRYLNEEMWFKGIRKPLAKIKVKVKKFESGIVKVELAEIPAVVKFKMDRENKILESGEKKKSEKVAEKPEEKKEEEKKVEVEKEKSVVDAGIKQAEQTHREIKHEVGEKKGIKKPLARKALQK